MSLFVAADKDFCHWFQAVDAAAVVVLFNLRSTLSSRYVIKRSSPDRHAFFKTTGNLKPYPSTRLFLRWYGVI